MFANQSMASHLKLIACLAYYWYLVGSLFIGDGRIYTCDIVAESSWCCRPTIWRIGQLEGGAVGS